MRSKKTKEGFIKYLEEHPDERFWQAVRNFSGKGFVYVSDVLREGDYFEDTFYWEEGTSIRTLPPNTGDTDIDQYLIGLHYESERFICPARSGKTCECTAKDTIDKLKTAITKKLNEARIDELNLVKSCFADLQDDAEAVYIESNYIDYRIAELQATKDKLG